MHMIRDIKSKWRDKLLNNNDFFRIEPDILVMKIQSVNFTEGGWPTITRTKIKMSIHLLFQSVVFKREMLDHYAN